MRHTGFGRVCIDVRETPDVHHGDREINHTKDMLMQYLVWKSMWHQTQTNYSVCTRLLTIIALH